MLAILFPEFDKIIGMLRHLFVLLFVLFCHVCFMFDYVAPKLEVSKDLWFIRLFSFRAY